MSVIARVSLVLGSLLGLLAVFVVSEVRPVAESVPLTGAEPRKGTRSPSSKPQPPRAEPGSDTSVPSAAGGRKRPLLIAVGGDVNLGRETGQRILSNRDYDPFARLSPIWGKAGLRFVNLESQLTERGGETQSPRNRLIFCGPPTGAEVLLRAGIGVVSTANNHAWDYGKRALIETLANLNRVGVKPVGTSATPGQAYEPRIIQVEGWSIALFAVTHIWNLGVFAESPGEPYAAWARYDKLHEKLKQARRRHDIVLVSYHGGAEYVDYPTEMTKRFVAPVMKAGVDALVGHHPHVPQGVGWHEDRPILYSLGNLVFNTHTDKPWTARGYVGLLHFEPDGSLQVFACPYRIIDQMPRALHPSSDRDELRRFERRLRMLSHGLGKTELGVLDERGCYPIAPRRKDAGKTGAL